MMRRQRMNPKPTKVGDRIILGAFALRFLVGLVAFSLVTVSAFRAEPRFGWMVLLISLAYAAVAGTILVKNLLRYRQRYGTKKQ